MNTDFKKPSLEGYAEYAKAFQQFDVSEVEDTTSIATSLRYERLFRAIIVSETSEHANKISTLFDAEQAVMAYTSEYLMDLPLPYSGISYLCATLIHRCKSLGYRGIPDIWSKYADGDFDWDDELDALTSLNVIG